MSILDLPSELLRAVASHLDVASAGALAQASPSHFEESADSRIYRDITITHAQQFAPKHNLVPVESPPASPTHRPITDPQQSTQSILKAVGSRTVLRAHIVTLQSRPWRAGQVRKLDIELGHTIPRELDELLGLVSGGLVELRVAHPNHHHWSTTDERIQPLGQHFQLPDRSFHALRKADIEIGRPWASLLGGLLARAPNLKALRVIGDALEAVRDDAGATDLLDPLPQRDQPHLELKLPALEVGPISLAVVPLIANIIRRSPRLAWLQLNDPTHRWQPQADDPLLRAIIEHATLRHLDIPSSCLRAIQRSDSSALCHLKHLTIIWNFIDLNAMINDHTTSALPRESLLPALPNLETCTFDLRSYDPGVPSYEVFQGKMFDESIQAIRNHALHTSFASTPSLQSIELGNMYGLANIGPVDFSHSEDKWAKFDGALITHYEDGGDHLVLLRHRSAFSCGWEMFAVLNGSEVRLNVIAQIRDGDGKSLNRAEPGPGQLSEAGWGVLRHWTAHLP